VGTNMTCFLLCFVRSFPFPFFWCDVHKVSFCSRVFVLTVSRVISWTLLLPCLNNIHSIFCGLF
jgi:hypothetical protein